MPAVSAKYRVDPAPTGVDRDQIDTGELISGQLDSAVASRPAACGSNTDQRQFPGPPVAKRAAFLTVTGLLAGAVGIWTVGASHEIVNHRLFSCTAGYCSSEPPYGMLALVAGGLLALLYVQSRPDREHANTGMLEEIAKATREVTLAVVGMIIFAFSWRGQGVGEPFSRGTVLVTLLLGVVTFSLYRILVRHTLISLRRRGNNVIRVVVVGETPSARAFMSVIANQPGRGYRCVAHLDESAATGDLSQTLAELAGRTHFEEVLIASRSLGRAQMSSLVGRRELRDTTFRVIPELFGFPPAKVHVASVLGDFPLLTLFEDPLVGDDARHLKRVIDLIGASILIVLTAPVMAIAAVAVRRSSSGQVLFRQERVGRDGRPFDMLKFRSMFVDAPDVPHRDLMRTMLTAVGTEAHNSEGTAPSGAVALPSSEGLFKDGNDPRVTPAGKVLRRYSIDELPQLFNVIRGEMSLVGPRPALAYEVELYADWHRRRLDVRPGITGLWQVSGRSRLSPADMLRLDVSYAESWSPLGDLRIILRTIPAILRDDAR
jgi:exopolysaccharide biosynthesis polyprenyl glycosylphosphotransferase